MTDQGWEWQERDLEKLQQFLYDNGMATTPTLRLGVVDLAIGAIRHLQERNEVLRVEAEAKIRYSMKIMELARAGQGRLDNADIMEACFAVAQRKLDRALPILAYFAGQCDCLCGDHVDQLDAAKALLKEVEGE